MSADNAEPGSVQDLLSKTNGLLFFDGSDVRVTEFYPRGDGTFTLVSMRNGDLKYSIIEGWLGVSPFDEPVRYLAKAAVHAWEAPS